jgi:ribose 5-phosphate isomerase B
MSFSLAIGADHAGFTYKSAVVDWLSEQERIIDFGPNSAEAVDYPDYAHKVAEAVEKGHAKFGVLFCGSGNGVAMTANKHQGIRAALCWTPELAGLARQHNNANVLCIPARFVSLDETKKMIEVFLGTHFEGGRHERRVDKISC